MARKKKVGIITFHASHNYGSMLQAYALQQTVIGMGYDCEIINFRTVRQREFYRPIFVRGSFIDKAKRCVFYAPYIYAWKKKHWLSTSPARLRMAGAKDSSSGLSSWMKANCM